MIIGSVDKTAETQGKNNLTKTFVYVTLTKRQWKQVFFLCVIFRWILIDYI